jgi:ABC-type Na+ transport system ATPase subunit NatA
MIGGQQIPDLYIEEKGVEGIFSYLEASSGMFKTIFLIVFLNLIQDGSCVLIDNAADGLDYTRSMYLPRFVERAAENKQIILCVNNEILLNQTDIRNWNVIYRRGSDVTAHNYKNSKDRLSKFADTGLSNYEYFREKYFLKNEE